MTINNQKYTPITLAYLSSKEALMRFVKRFSLNSDPEDVVQEAFARAYIVEQSSAIEQPKSYLFRVAKHLVLNDKRAVSRRPTDFLEDVGGDDVLASGWTLYDELEAEEKIGLHCAAIAALPKKCREVYSLRKIYGLTRAEIAQQLDIKMSTVEGHITRGYAHCDAYIERRMQVSPTTRAVEKGNVK